MLKKGLAWHYTAYDKRPELEKVVVFACNPSKCLSDFFCPKK